MPTPIVRPSAETTSTANRSLRPSTISSSRARAVQRVPAGAAATCLTQTSNPTVALPGSSTGLQNKAAARDAETVILSVPFRNQVENLANLHEALTEGQLLIDATVPLAAAFGGKATRTLGVWQGSAAEQARELSPEG